MIPEITQQQPFPLSLRKKDILFSSGIRILFIGSLHLLSESLKLAAENAMEATRGNDKMVVSICLAYKSSNSKINTSSCNTAKLEFLPLFGTSSWHDTSRRSSFLPPIFCFTWSMEKNSQLSEKIHVEDTLCRTNSESHCFYHGWEQTLRQEEQPAR